MRACELTAAVAQAIIGGEAAFFAASRERGRGKWDVSNPPVARCDEVAPDPGVAHVPLAGALLVPHLERRLVPIRTRVTVARDTQPDSHHVSTQSAHLATISVSTLR